LILEVLTHTSLVLFIIIVLGIIKDIAYRRGLEEGFDAGRKIMMTKIKQNAVYGYEIKRRKP